MRAPGSGQIVINFDENGKASALTPGGVIPIPSLGNINDPVDPSSPMKPLAYDLTAAIPGISPTAGDVLLTEPGTSAISDLLRWEGLASGIGSSGFGLYVYSDLPEPGEINPPLADVGIPTIFQGNRLSLLETGPETGPNGLFGYTPLPGQPGAIQVSVGSVTYNFTSDPLVPEPASLVLLLVGTMALPLRRRAIVP